MKYLDADLLRKEIEFAKSVYDNPKRVVAGVADAFRQDGRAAMCDDNLKKIDSLQQEQQEVDLEKELEQYARNHPADDAGSYRNLIGIAHHFYELGKNSK